MAKIATQTIAITVSKLVKDNTPLAPMVGDELVSQLEALIGELVPDVVVEATLLDE